MMLNKRFSSGRPLIALVWAASCIIATEATCEISQALNLGLSDSVLAYCDVSSGTHSFTIVNPLASGFYLLHFHGRN